jgi:hypothetical protein
MIVNVEDLEENERAEMPRQIQKAQELILEKSGGNRKW